MRLQDKLANLRRELKNQGLDGFIIPRADAHQGEYVPASEERLKWITSFSGSAGEAIVLQDRAAIFVDGRYTLQARAQVDTNLFTFHDVSAHPAIWLASVVGEGDRIGYDPWLFSLNQIEAYKKIARSAGFELVATDQNPVDEVWQDRPDPPLGAIVPHPMEYAGVSAQEKIELIADTNLHTIGADASILTLPDSIAWLLNVRGHDVPHAPMPLSFAILYKDHHVDWLVDDRKLTPECKEYLADLNGFVHLHNPNTFPELISALGEKTVMVDPQTAPEWVFMQLQENQARILELDDPCILPKAAKNETELEGARQAHLRDGQALTRFLHWLDKVVHTKPLTELDVVEKLYEYRSESNMFRDISFRTIAGSGPNGALPHYAVTEQSNRTLQEGDMMVLDSGGQYLDGTTDITRTFAIGQPSQEMRDRFTRVLKGHIALAMARFPFGTNGGQLDSLARYPLWQVGLDYNHGTGHGVGSYLSVHEGPQKIAKVRSSALLVPGMIISNEPGYYKTGEFGIRIENLVAVRESPKQAGDEMAMLEFETLSLAPLDKSLIDVALLTPQERGWVDAYHQLVYERLIPALDEQVRDWLKDKTRAL